MVKFTIFLPTYNRHTLVARTLASVVGQTYRDLEILLYDNGSSPPARAIADGFHDERIRYKRFDENQDINDVAEDAIDRMSGTHFLFLADDDVLLPRALEVVEHLLRSHDVEILHAGFTHFDHSARLCDIRELEQFKGIPEILNAREMAWHYANGWGIGPRREYRAPRASHSSAIYLAKSLIDRTRRRQGQLFIKPFGDIGYVGALLNAETCLCVDLPLAVVGETPVREMNGAKPGQRMKWANDVRHLEHSPLRSASFVNMGADAHLKVLARNGIADARNIRLRPDFFIRHLRQVLSDRPWTGTTLKDTIASIPHALASMAHYPPSPGVGLRRLLGRLRRSLADDGPPRAPKMMPFEDINQCAAWVQANCVEPILEARAPGAWS